MEPYVCQDNVCILGDTPEPPEPDTCSDDKPCDEGVCVDGSCVLLGTMGDPCDTNEDCQDGLTCHDEVCMKGAGTSDPNREGAKLHFTVYAQNDNCVPATEEAQIFRAYIDVINPTTGLVFGKRQVSIIVPGEINHDQIN
jgi:hypothetical protein